MNGFAYYNPNPVNRIDGYDCVVRAFAFFFGVTWMRALFDIVTWCANRGLVRFNYRSSYNVYLEEKGFKRHKPPKKGLSVGQFRDEYADVYKTYIVSGPHHLTIINNKDILDISDCSEMKMDGYWVR